MRKLNKRSHFKYRKYKFNEFGYNGVQGSRLLSQSQLATESLFIVLFATKDPALDTTLVAMKKKNTLINYIHQFSC